MGSSLLQTTIWLDDSVAMPLEIIDTLVEVDRIERLELSNRMFRIIANSKIPAEFHIGFRAHV